jgi:tetratricopeptide (TPR) repeat protein
MRDLASRFLGVRLTILVFVLGSSLTAGRVAAGGAEDARAYNEKATAAFALGRYGEAATFFEKAFEMKTDPALLYNAAQAHRMAGNKERALALYQNYLRVYGAKGKRTDVEAHIEELKKAIAHDQEVANSPPTNTEPIGGGQPEPGVASDQPAAPPLVPAAPLPAATATGPAAAVLVAQPAPASAEDNRSLTQKPWFWVAVGAGVAAAVTVVLLVALGGSKDPSPSIGVVP